MELHCGDKGNLYNFVFVILRSLKKCLIYEKSDAEILMVYFQDFTENWKQKQIFTLFTVEFIY